MNKMKERVLGFLAQGLTPHKLSLAVSLGICLGIMPLLGVTTLLCTFVAFLLRINMAAIQSANYLVYPLQLLLFVPFLQLGAHFVGIPFDYSIAEITQKFSDQPWATMAELLWINLAGWGLWLGCLPVLLAVCYFPLRILFARLIKTSKPVA